MLSFRKVLSGFTCLFLSILSLNALASLQDYDYEPLTPSPSSLSDEEDGGRNRRSARRLGLEGIAQENQLEFSLESGLTLGPLSPVEEQNFIWRLQQQSGQDLAVLVEGDGRGLNRIEISKEDLLKFSGPFLEQLAENIVHKKESWTRAGIRTATKVLLTLIPAYFEGLFFASDPAIGTLFQINTEKQAMIWGVCTSILQYGPQYLELEENLEYAKGLISKKERDLHRRGRKAKRFLNTLLWTGALAKGAEAVQLYRQIGFQGGLDWIEAGFMPIVAIQSYKIQKGCRGFVWASIL